MINGERGENKLTAVRHLDIGDVVSRRAGPTGLGPQAKAFASLDRDAGETVSLIVGVAACARVIAFQKFHHGRRAGGVCGFSRDNLHQQTRSSVSRELVAILAVWTTRHALATVS